MDEINTTEAQTVAELAVAAVRPCFLVEGAKPFVIVPDGHRLEGVEGELPAPTRKHGTITVRDVDSFVDVVAKYGTDQTSLYHTVEPPRFEAIFNDDGAEGTAGPGWGDFLARYSCPLSPEWKAWTAQNKRTMNQADFAQFIEDNLPDIVTTTGGEMLEISRTLQAKKKVDFASGIRLDNGQTEFTYVEKIDGTAGGKGQLRVPEVFTIGVPVFEGGQRYGVQARLRYRISDAGALSLWFDLERPHKVIEDAVQQLAAHVAEKTGRKLINGSRD